MSEILTITITRDIGRQNNLEVWFDDGTDWTKIDEVNYSTRMDQGSYSAFDPFMEFDLAKEGDYQIIHALG